jgi:hypothetical protein
MTLTLPLVLVGLVAVDQPESTALRIGAAVQQSTTVPPQPSGSFQVVPLTLGSQTRLPPFQAFTIPKVSASVGVPTGVVRQLENKRTGVTCTMRIVQANPTFDLGILAPSSGPHPDPIVRNSISPCVP